MTCFILYWNASLFCRHEKEKKKLPAFTEDWNKYGGEGRA